MAPRIDEAEEDASPPSGSHCLAAAITAALEPPAHASDPPSIHLAPVIIAPVLDDETLQRMSPPPSRPSVDARVPSSFALEPYVAGAGIAAPPRWRWWHALLALLVVLTLSIAARGLRRG